MKFILPFIITCFIAYADEHRIESVAGTGKAGFSGDGGPAIRAEINNPYGLVIGPEGALYFCDMSNHRIRKIDRSGLIATVAGKGKGYSGDGGPALEAELNEPYEIRFDRKDNMYFVEMRNNVIRRVDAKTKIISSIPAGDLKQPHSIQFIGGDELWICDIGNHRIRSVDVLNNLVKTVGGTGERTATREGAPLENNPLNGPRAIDIAPDGTIWIALREGNAIYRAAPKTRLVHRAAGTGKQGFTGDGGDALEATLSGPKGITISQENLVYWADTESHTIRYLDPGTGTIHLLAGTGRRGDGKDGDAKKCDLARPHGVFADASGYLWIGDSENHRLRRVRIAGP